MADELFTKDDIIFEYTLAQALEDGVLVDANIGDFAEVTLQHFKTTKVYMTRALFDLIEKAVANKRWCNDWKGVWHDILWMSQGARRHLQIGRPAFFQLIITGTGRKKLYTLQVALGFATPESKEPHLVYMMEDED